MLVEKIDEVLANDRRGLAHFQRPQQTLAAVERTPRRVAAPVLAENRGLVTVEGSLDGHTLAKLVGGASRLLPLVVIGIAAALDREPRLSRRRARCGNSHRWPGP